MGCKLHCFNIPILAKTQNIKFYRPSYPSTLKSTVLGTVSPISCTLQDPPTTLLTQPTVKFQTLKSCKLGISRYPDFEYNAEGGAGNGIVLKTDTALDDEITVSFDVETLYIPPLSAATTRFLGLPLPPFLKIDIVPEFLRGVINKETGKVDLQFRSKFWFSVGTFYRAPPLVVETILTSEESTGAIRSGKGERMDGEGRCMLVGVATVDPIDDILMDSFLGLPTECIAVLNARISIS